MLVLLVGLCQKGLDLEESCSLFLQEQEQMICLKKNGKDHKDNGTGRAKKSALQATYPIQSGRDRQRETVIATFSSKR